MIKYLAFILSMSLLLSQNDGAIYSTLTGSSDSESYSSYKIDPDGFEVENLMPFFRFQDVSSNQSKILFNKADSIFIYDFESLRNLNVTASSALFTFYEDFIILAREDKIVRYSLGDSSEVLISDSIANTLPGPSWAPRLFFILSPDKKDIISIKGHSWTEGPYFNVPDSLKIVLSNIENLEQTFVRIIPYTDCGFYWREDGYLYFSNQYLYKINIYDSNEAPIQLTNEDFGWILPTNDKNLDKIILSKFFAGPHSELWVYDFASNQISYLDELENPYLALRQSWSPDNIKVVVGTIRQIGFATAPGNLISYNIAEGGSILIQGNTYLNLYGIRNNLFWHGDYDGQVKIENTNVPFEASLSNAYPNPFNPHTNINYVLNQDAHVKLSVYDVVGNLVKNIINAEQSSGFTTVRWDATNANGIPVSAGVYLYTIETTDFIQTKKMILLK